MPPGIGLLAKEQHRRDAGCGKAKRQYDRRETRTRHRGLEAQLDLLHDVYQTQTGLGQRTLILSKCEHRHREQLPWPLESREERTRSWQMASPPFVARARTLGGSPSLSHVGPRVRIRLPPAESRMQTSIRSLGPREDNAARSAVSAGGILRVYGAGPFPACRRKGLRPAIAKGPPQAVLAPPRRAGAAGAPKKVASNFATLAITPRSLARG
jgi:hypothetical protein